MGRRKLALCPRPCREDADLEHQLGQQEDDELQAVIAQHGDLAQAQAVIDQRRAALHAAEDAAWERAKEQERACFLCDDEPESDPEPQGGAERRADVQPKPRTVRLGARLEGSHLNVLVPSSSTSGDHIVTCREVKRNGVELYLALDCTCADFAFRKRKTAKTPNTIPAPCKHMKQAARHAREQAVLEASR